MNNITIYLKKILEKEQLTCIIGDEKDFYYKSKERGIKPLYDFINSCPCDGPYYLADKIIGKAAAFLCVKAGIKEVFSNIMSTSATEIFEKNSISYFYDSEVPHIMNRSKTGLCPMEGLSQGINNPDEMFLKIENWLKSLKSS